MPYLAGWAENGALEAITEAAELIDQIAARIEKAAGLQNAPADGDPALPVAA